MEPVLINPQSSAWTSPTDYIGLGALRYIPRHQGCVYDYGQPMAQDKPAKADTPAYQNERLASMVDHRKPLED